MTLQREKSRENEGRAMRKNKQSDRHCDSGIPGVSPGPGGTGRDGRRVKAALAQALPRVSREREAGGSSIEPGSGTRPRRLSPPRIGIMIFCCCCCFKKDACKGFGGGNFF